MKTIAKLEGANKIYKTGDTFITALDKTTLEIREGELLLIIGPSGSGKTTLLSLIGCLINPTEGNLFINGVNIKTFTEKKKSKLRLDLIGFVFQQFNLLAPLSSYENIAFPLLIQQLSIEEIRNKTDAALKLVGMENRRKSLPKQLSGGEQQRVAIARALVTNPQIILCDEPTAALDKDSVDVVMKELVKLSRDGKAVAVVTHDPRLKQYADRIVEVKNGIALEVDKSKYSL